MGTSKDFAAYCCELLSSVGPCVAKRMFGGYGLSTDGLTIGLIADLGQGERLYLKADELSRPRFAAAGGLQFLYEAKGKTMGLNYFTVPDEAMESPQEMRTWALTALETAIKARKPAPPRKGRTALATKSAAKPNKTSVKPAAKPATAVPTAPKPARKSTKG
jgi:DNA transformation protein